MNLDTAQRNPIFKTSTHPETDPSQHWPKSGIDGEWVVFLPVIHIFIIVHPHTIEVDRLS